ncbi:MAG: glycoside hydrolase family 16 protein [Acholeplasmataceae bacterium]|nr:glycoside hydrolase family 16 protein [Acholeplasmataceae bacterium]
MKKILLIFIVFALAFVLIACEDKETNTGNTGTGVVPIPDDTFCKDINSDYNYETLDYQLVWSDEFNGDELNMSNWKHEIGGSGWGNNELQYYTDRSDNSYVQNGSLFIKLIKESYEDNNYTSARLVSKDLQDFKYGKFEISAKLPRGKGTWPAIWMMPTSSYYGVWPNSGEIDIMEHVGYDFGNVHHSIHTEFFNHPLNTQKSGSDYYENLDTIFHKYSLEWLPDKLMFYVDDQIKFTYDVNAYDCVKKGHWPFDKDFFVILNLAFGGFWGGAQGIDSSLTEATFEIDYVRVYQDDSFN